MKIRTSFFSNSSSSSYIIAFPRNYQFSEEELTEIKKDIKDTDYYFLRQKIFNSKQEFLTEAEKIQKMLATGDFSDGEFILTDDMINQDIQKAAEFLYNNGCFYMYEDYGYNEKELAIRAISIRIMEVLNNKIIIGTINTGPDEGSIFNILAKENKNKQAFTLIKECINEN